MKAFVLLAFCTAAFAQQKIDDAESKKLFEMVCGRCHELSLTTGRRSTHDEWMDLVQRMAQKGANATDDQFFAIVDYLTKNYGPAKLRINEALAPDVAAFFAISQSDAEAIVKYRRANGLYKTLDDLFKAGADRNKIEAKKDAIEF